MTDFNALRVTLSNDGNPVTELVTRRVEDLPSGDVLIAVHYSCLNYKDALSAAGNPGVTRHYPHTPGIDAAGLVIEDNTGTYSPGTRVIVSGYDLGMNTDGGLAEMIRVPHEWVVPCPENLSLLDAMSLGTAGLTAAMCLDKLERMGANPAAAPALLVTGATGGVGSWAILLAARRGYQVTAMTGKTDQSDFLKRCGAHAVIAVDDWRNASSRPLLTPQFTYTVDTLGGETLFEILKATDREGAVASCGLAAGAAFEGNVYPFILRGVSLLGVDSAEQSVTYKTALWQRLASELLGFDIASLHREVVLAEVPALLNDMLAGRSRGRIVVNLEA